MVVGGSRAGRGATTTARTTTTSSDRSSTGGSIAPSDHHQQQQQQPQQQRRRRRVPAGAAAAAAAVAAAMPLLMLLLGGGVRSARAFVQRPQRLALPVARAAVAAARARPLSMSIDSQPFSTPSAAAATAAAATHAPAPQPSTAELLDLELPEFRRLGLDEEVVRACSAYGLTEPSAIQKLAVPPALKGDDLAFAAATGSGKTLAYLLPIIQQLKWQEAAGVARQACRPRALVLVPTRELVSQVLEVIKALGHTAKVASCGLHGGDDFGAQRRRLQGTVDIVVASPGRLLQHYERGHVFFSQVKHVVVDEMDTMLKDGFGPDLKKLLVPLEQKSKRDKVQYLMATATLTPAVRRLMEHEQFPQTRYLQSQDAHRSLPTLRHIMLDTKGGDKVQLLLDVLSQSKQKGERVMVFCNTVQSCRAVEHALREVALPALCYHGEMHSEDRAASLDKFKQDEAGFLVCTDIASRGLDMPFVEHVVMFDFPLNPIEYLHRSGRTARMGAKGKVTSLLTKRDRVLAQAIQTAVAKGLPLDALSSRKRDYEQGGKLSGLKQGRVGAAGGGGGGSSSGGRRSPSFSSSSSSRFGGGGGGRGGGGGNRHSKFGGGGGSGGGGGKVGAGGGGFRGGGPAARGRGGGRGGASGSSGGRGRR